MDGWGSQAWNAAACHPLHSVSAVWSGASQLLGWLPSSSMHRCAAICNFSCISSEFHFGCMFCSLGWGQFGKIVFQLLRCGLRHVMWKLSSWLPAWADLGTLTWELCMGTCKVHWTSSWHGIITDFSFLRKLSICHNWCFLSLGVKSNCSWGLLPCHPSCKTIGFAIPRRSSNGLLLGFALTSMGFTLRLVYGSLDHAKCIFFQAKF